MAGGFREKFFRHNIFFFKKKYHQSLFSSLIFLPSSLLVTAGGRGRSRKQEE
jgi:hypothetical protein